MVKGKIMDKVKASDLKPSATSPVIPQTIPVEPITEEPTPVEPPAVPEPKAKKTAKSKAKSETSAKPAFSNTAKINKYGFLHFSNGMMKTIGLEKGVDHTVRIKYADGILQIEFSLGGNV